MLKVSSAGL